MFTIDGIKLKLVKNFKYLGRQISSRDSNTPMIFMNLAKARKHLFCIFVFIATEGADPVVGGKIYVAAVLSVLLYGSDS